MSPGLATKDHDSKSARGRPCDACRRRKSKCVTEQGKTICVLCHFHNQSCTYLERPQPRKRQASSGSTVDGPSQVKRPRLFHTKPGTGVEEEEYDALQGPSLLKRTLGLQNRHHTEYVGPNAIPDVYGAHKADSENGLGHEQSQATSDFVRFVHPSAAFRIIPDTETIGYDKERADIDEIEATAQGHGIELVHLYFRIVHPSFPILHKDVFLEKYARSYREFSPPLLAAVYLLASAYWVSTAFKPDLCGTSLTCICLRATMSLWQSLASLIWRSYRSSRSVHYRTQYTDQSSVPSKRDCSFHNIKRLSWAPRRTRNEIV